MLTPETSLDDGRVIFGPTTRDESERDPVCGLEVEADAPIRTDHQGESYAFCSDACRQKFLAQPEAFVKPVAER